MWRERPLGNLAAINSGGTPSTDRAEFWGGDIPWVTPTDITACKTNYLFDTANRITKIGLNSCSAKLLPAGSILFTSRATVGVSRIAGIPVCTNQGFKSLTPATDTDGKFLFYQVQRLRGAFERYAAGSTFPEINKKDTARVLIPHPTDIRAQQKIAAILSTIDTAIEQTEALIEKYQHIKAGLMHDLFTRGVLPNGQLRPPRDQAPELYQETAIGWIPREWRLRPLGEMASIVSGVTLGAKTGPTDTIDAPYLRVANVQDGYLNLSEIKTVRISPKTLEQLRLEPGDVLMNEGGDFDKLGRGAVWQGEIENCVHQNHVFRVRCNAGTLLPTFLAFFSESTFGKKYFVMSSKQSTNLASINSTQLKAYPIAVPPLTEQAAITLHVHRAKYRQDTLKAEATKLQTQKLGLMQDLLTGKVPVVVNSSDNAAHAP